MSIILVADAFRSSIPPTQRFVFVALCDSSNDRGECYPSVKTICEKTGLSERSVRGAIKWLCDHGYMHIEERNGRSNLFYIHSKDQWPELSTPPASPAPQGCNSCTPAPDAPLQEMHPTPAPDAPPPLHVVHPTPASPAPPLHLTVKEPSIEPSGKRETRAAAYQTVCRWLVESGVCSNPHDMRIRQVVEKGVPLETVKAAIDKAKEKAAGIGYVIGTLNGWEEQARNIKAGRTTRPPGSNGQTYQEGCMQNAAIAAKKLFGEDYDTSRLS